MAISLVAHGTLVTNVATGTSTAFNMTGANFLVAHVDVFGYTPVVSSFSDSSGNTWQALSEYVGNPTHVFPGFFYCVNPTVTSTQTFTFTGTTSDAKGICIAGFSGVDTQSPIDFTVTTQGISTNIASAGACAPAQNGQLVISCLSYVNSTLTSTNSAPSGFTVADIIPPVAGPMGCTLAYLIEGTASSVNPAWTFTSSVSQWAQLNIVVTGTQTNGLVQTQSFVASTNGSTAVTTGMDTRNANFIFVGIGSQNAPTITDNLSNTYTAITTYVNGANQVITYYSANPTVSSTHTFTCSGSLPFLQVVALNGMSTTPFDTSVGTGQNNPGTLTPTNNNEILFTEVSLMTNANLPITNQYGWQLLGSSGSNTNCGGGGVAFKRATTKKATTIAWNSGNAFRASNITAFIVSNNITTNQTITGVARIQTSVNQTLTGKARIGANVNQAITGLARIGSNVLKTLTGKSSIKNTTTQTLTGKSRIGGSTSRAITGVSRLQITSTQLLSGKARLITVTNQTLTGISRMLSTTLQTITGVAAIGQTSQQTITGKSRVQLETSKTITGKAFIFRQTPTNTERTFHVMADKRNYPIPNDNREFDALKDARTYKVVK